MSLQSHLVTTPRWLSASPHRFIAHFDFVTDLVTLSVNFRIETYLRTCYTDRTEIIAMSVWKCFNRVHSG